MDHFEVIIVGAGVWGLCAAKTFLAIDPSLRLLIVDSKKTVGGVWADVDFTRTMWVSIDIREVEFARVNLTDADLATEVTKMTQQQILTSAATSVLAQANSAPQAILKLLQ